MDIWIPPLITGICTILSTVIPFWLSRKYSKEESGETEKKPGLLNKVSLYSSERFDGLGIILYSIVVISGFLAGYSIRDAIITSTPKAEVLSLTKNDTFLVRGQNLPLKRNIRIILGLKEYAGRNGLLLGNIQTGNATEMELEYPIPESYKGRNDLAVRFEEDTDFGEGFSFSANFPENPSNASGLFTPTFSIQSVDQGKTVSIRTYNFPANDTFNVVMGYMGTRGIGGIRVATIHSKQGGSFTIPLDIPDALKEQEQIAIRFESPTTGDYSYNWFWNNTFSSTKTP